MLKLLLLLASVVALPGVAAPAPPPASSQGPAALEYLLQKGVEVHTHFSTPGEMTGYIATLKDGKPFVFFIPEDGSVAIFGHMIDAQGRDLTRAYLYQYRRGPHAAKLFKKLDERAWIVEGASDPERIVYAFVDPNCPYCWHLWKAAQHYYNQGLQMRYIIVAILGRSSLHKAAAILAADDPGHAFRTNEAGFRHHSGAIEPMHEIPGKLRARIAANNALMAHFGFNGTPAMVWRNDSGTVRTINGLPREHFLEKIFGVASPPKPD